MNEDIQKKLPAIKIVGGKPTTWKLILTPLPDGEIKCWENQWMADEIRHDYKLSYCLINQFKSNAEIAIAFLKCLKTLTEYQHIENSSVFTSYNHFTLNQCIYNLASAFQGRNTSDSTLAYFMAFSIWYRLTDNIHQAWLHAKLYEAEEFKDRAFYSPEDLRLLFKWLHQAKALALSNRPEISTPLDKKRLTSFIKRWGKKKVEDYLKANPA